MSILIKGMEMPKSCWSCDMPLSALKCPVQTEEEAMRYCSCRHKNCPLVSVPPHGRLIDADALVNELVHSEFFSMSDYNNFVGLTLKAPTVIPAEEASDA